MINTQLRHSDGLAMDLVCVLASELTSVRGKLAKLATTGDRAAPLRTE